MNKNTLKQAMAKRLISTSKASFFPGPPNIATEQMYKSCNSKFSGRVVPSA